MASGKLYLIPCPVSDADPAWVIPPMVEKTVAGLTYFIVENEKTARRMLRRIHAGIDQQQLRIHVLDKHHPESGIDGMLAPVLEGQDAGLMSEAGSPAVADPGAMVVRTAHERGIRVVPLAGPSSILLALMSSGMNGQSFCFHGYLPVDKDRRRAEIQRLERESAANGRTQIFIETPYRNDRLLEALVTGCKPTTLLGFACDLTGPDEWVATRTALQWKKAKPVLGKRPCVFLMMGS
jgi:16S rRNA (cytidine1402-2'-O)-methyltransferase